MKQKKLIFNFFVNRNWKKLTDSRKIAKILADNRKSHHPIETLLEACAFGARLGNQSVFILDPRLLSVASAAKVLILTRERIS